MRFVQVLKVVLLSLLLSLAAITGSSAKSTDPLLIVVSLSNQNLKVFQGTSEITSSNISSGKSGHTTPTGIFSILQKNKHHRSNIYSNAPMPFMQRLTWSGIALHASNHVPRHPASHGCIRMPHSFAGKLFKMSTNGAHVIIEDNTSLPERIVHPTLFQPIKTWTQSKKLDTWVNTHIGKENWYLSKPDNRHPARIFITRRTHKDDLFDVQRLLNKLGYEAGSVDGLMGPATWKAIKNYQSENSLGANGEVNNELLESLYKAASEPRPANGRLLIRKHHKTIFETEIHIKDAHKPLGSHLLTVSNFNPAKNSTEWIGITTMDRIQERLHLPLNAGVQLDKSTDRHNLKSTLSRIQMSALDRELVSRHLSPNSSITISDNGMSIETGAKGTDFIVLTKPEAGISRIASNNTQ